jgi:bifunctional non-homologous end joining protein LigD
MKAFKPMLAKLIDAPFDDKDWIFEIKWDGFRAIGIKNKSVELLSRLNNSLNSRFKIIAKELETIKGEFVVDGEIIIQDEEGKARFQLIQNYQTTQIGTPVYYIFDLLYLNGKDLRSLPLLKRKALLKKLLIGKHPHIKYSDHIEEKGKAFFKEAVKKGLEGIMAKRKDSAYQSSRSSDWLKIKSKMRQEVVIGGYTAPRGGRSYFGALLVGIFKKGDLEYCGHVGTGYDEKLLKSLYSEMVELKSKECPFKIKPKANSPVTWVKPKLIAEVAFQEWTEEGIMRQPVFQGLRDDKKPKQVNKEEAAVSNPSKVLWPNEGITKGDLIHYYEEISEYILPYLKNRPLVMHRFPNGIDKEGFYQKEAGTHLPDFVKTFAVQHEDRKINYIVVDNVETLLYVANLGSIEMHPFNATCKHLLQPDYLVFDLDPEAIDFEEVIKTANTLHDFLDELNVPNYCKTSGSRGLHIYVPVHAKYDYETVRELGRLIASLVNEKLPKITSLERSPKKRQGKVYIDYLQNREMQTVVAPYSVRPKPNATVSTPLEWSEVKKVSTPRNLPLKQSLPALRKKATFSKKF